MDELPLMLDRQAETDRLTVAAEAAASGRGRFLIIEGAPGIGKTALLNFVRTVTRRKGILTLCARGVDLEQEFAFGVVRQLFDSSLIRPDGTASPFLTGAAGPASPVFDMSTDHGARLPGEFGILSGLFWLTTNLCQKHRTVALIIDDLHWIDTPSARFLAYLQPRMEDLPLLVVASQRTEESGPESRVVDQVRDDQSCHVLHPGSLSLDATAQLVQNAFGGDANESFVIACRSATGGNPLLLQETIRALLEEGVEPRERNVARVEEVGSRALTRRVKMRMSQMPRVELTLAKIIAVAGTEIDLHLAARIADVNLTVALSAAGRLEQSDILTFTGARPDAVRFIHPLVRTAVYRAISPDVRAGIHRKIAEELRARGADVELISAHILRIPATGAKWVTEVLRNAATRAMSRGSPEGAVTYLKRCLTEPLDEESRLDSFALIGNIAQFFDAEEATGYLSTAFDNSPPESRRRLKIAPIMGSILFWQERNDEAIDIYLHALREVEPEDLELRRRLEAGLIDMALDDPTVYQLMVNRIKKIQKEPLGVGAGARMLDCLVALHAAFSGMNRNEVIGRALSGLEGEDLYVTGGLSPQELAMPDPSRISAYVCGCFALMSAEHSQAMPALERYLTRARTYGVLSDLLAGLSYRGKAWLWQGALPKALEDSQEALSLIEKTRYEIQLPYAMSVAIEALVGQGRLEEAEAVLQGVDLRRVTRSGHWFLVLESHARLLLHQRKYEEALEGMLEAGARFAAVGGDNPVFCPWRSGAAQCLWAMGETSQAQTYVDQELELAKKWGTRFAVGRALHMAGLVRGNSSGLDYMRQSVDLLSGATAKLALAQALVNYGSALRRGGHSADARSQLRRGLELAYRCGAVPLAETARAELRVIGDRPRRPCFEGVEALTPSESRVVELAVSGLSNRGIARELQLSVKTIEVHLTSAYRKMGITRRNQLSKVLHR
ncbi:helix-turn-helix transcriptional regulator [Streptomyces sp. 1222.5]|uniref:helix-turn-helix transcriptional regulator n=1 Tax=Streptomyces sp. 1222.5 TaxID=1881026 RepID=UPI003EB865B8